MEIMDRVTLEAAEAAYAPGYPDGAGAVLLVELDGVAAQVAPDTEEVDAHLPRRRAPSRSAPRTTPTSARGSGSAARRAFAAMGRVSPRLLRPGRRGAAHASCRTCLAPHRRALEPSTGSASGNVFHAGDGNLHPLVLYDGAADGEVERAKSSGRRDPRRLRRGRRLAHRRARRGRGQGVLDAARCSRSATSRRCSGCAARSTPPGSRTRARCFPTPRLCGEVPGPYRSTRSSGSGLRSVSEATRLDRGGVGAPRGGDARGTAAQDRRRSSRRAGSTACSSTRPAT